MVRREVWFLLSIVRREVLSTLLLTGGLLLRDCSWASFNKKTALRHWLQEHGGYILLNWGTFKNPGHLQKSVLLEQRVKPELNWQSLTFWLWTVGLRGKGVLEVGNAMPCGTNCICPVIINAVILLKPRFVSSGGGGFRKGVCKPWTCL